MRVFARTTASTASSRRSSTCRATASRRRSASGSARCWPTPSAAASRRSRPRSPTGRWCACTSSSRRDDGPAPCSTSPTHRGARSRAIMRTWEDQLGRCVWRADAGDRAMRLAAKYGDAFSAGYTETFSAAARVEDIARIERLGAEQPVAIDFYREPSDRRRPRARRRLSLSTQPIPLSERVPVLENLGFRSSTSAAIAIAPGARRRRARRRAARHGAGDAPTARRSISQRHDDAARRRASSRSARRSRERRLQPAGRRGRRRLARGGDAARARRLSAPDRARRSARATSPTRSRRTPASRATHRAVPTRFDPVAS